MVDAQARVDVHVVERLREVTGFALVRVAVQQHDGGVARVAQEVQEVQRVGVVQVAVPVAEAGVELQRFAES